MSLDELVGELDLLGDKDNYGYILQWTPVLLTRHDAELLNSKLDALAVPFENAVGSYLATKPV